MNPLAWAGGKIVRTIGYAIIGLTAIIDEHRERRLLEQGRKLASQREDLIALGIHPDRLATPQADCPHIWRTFRGVDSPHTKCVLCGVPATPLPFTTGPDYGSLYIKPDPGEDT